MKYHFIRHEFNNIILLWPEILAIRNIKYDKFFCNLDNCSEKAFKLLQIRLKSRSLNQFIQDITTDISYYIDFQVHRINFLIPSNLGDL